MEVVPFAEWSGRELPVLPSIPMPSPELWLHHGAAGASSVATLRAYLNHHVRNNRWKTIGYSFAVAEGRVFECRGPGRQGAHTYGRNHLSHGIVVCGDYTSTNPSQQDLDALVWLLRHGHQRRWWRHPQVTGGHRDAPGASTTCPGDGLHRLIPDINRRARSIDTGNDDMTPADRKLLTDTAAAVRRIEAQLEGRQVGDDLGRIRRSVRAIGTHLGIPVGDDLEPSGRIDA